MIVDNNDSFTWNLVELVRQSGLAQPYVLGSGSVRPSDEHDADGIILSPGPGLPAEHEGLSGIIGRNAGQKPVLGICLGHQAIALHYGARLINLPYISHGKRAEVRVLDHSGILSGAPDSFRAGLYHSWAVSKADLPSGLLITAEDERGVIMGLRHKEYGLEGLQFHPESYLTGIGKDLLSGWLSGISGGKHRII